MIRPLELKVIGEELEHHSMDVLDDDQIAILNAMVKMMNRHMYLSSINYETGKIGIGVHHNEGEPNAFDDNDYLLVNVNGESVGCMVWEVSNVLVHHL